MEVEKKKNKHFLFLIMIIFLIGLVIYWTDLQEFYDRSTLEKQELTVTKIVSKEQLHDLWHDQDELADGIWSDKTRRWRWLFYEIRDNEDLFDQVHFMEIHPEYDLIEVDFPMTRYTYEDGKVIEFVSGEGKMVKVHSENGWEKYKSTE